MTFRAFTLRRFVAYSLLAHLGATVAWGLPAYLTSQAATARADAEREFSDQLRRSETQTREHAREQRTEQTRREVEAEMRQQFDQLAAALPEQRRDELWQRVAPDIADESRHLAEALANPDATEQDLRTLEADLQRALVSELDEQLAGANARELAERFVDQVEREAAPELAQWLRDQTRDRIAQRMRQDAERLIDRQRDEAQRARDRALGALRELTDRAEQADRAAQAAAQASRTSGNADALARAQRETTGKLAESNERMAQAVAKLGDAGSASADLSPQAQRQVAAADAALRQAQTALAAASAAAQANAAQAQEAITAAQQATDAARSAARQAMDAVSSGNDRAAIAAAAVRADQAAIAAEVEDALAKELASTMLPRLAGRMQEAFAQQLSDQGLSDPSLAAEVGQAVQERLAAAIPGLAKAGAQVEERLANVGNVPADLAARPPSAAPSALDQALAEGLAGLRSNATATMAAIARDDSRYAHLVHRVTGNGQAAGTASDQALNDLQDRVAALARGMSSGRLGASGLGSGSGTGSGLASLRSGAMVRHARDEAAYQRVAGTIEGRTVVQGATWDRQGAQGATATASASDGPVPARVVGPAAHAAKPALVNDQPYTPTFASIAFTTVPYCPGDFRVDGNLAKWDAIPALTLKPEYGSDTSAQVAKLAWSHRGLFLLFRVTDPDRTLRKAEVNGFYQSDVVELWLDSFNTKEKHRSRHAGQQFWIWPAGSASDPQLTGGESIKATKEGGYQLVPLRQDRLERWATQTPDGWIIEARLDPAVIPDADLSPGRILGFNAYVTTMAGTNWFWSAGKQIDTFAQPDTWGDLLLAGSDATIAIDGSTPEAVKTAVVGEPLRLRVSDADMDLDPRSHDKVMVTLADRRGGQQQAVLEETGNSTGMFTGAVSTALALDEAVPAVLGVYEGETVRVTYIDQARANGAREARVETSVTFGSVVMAMGSSSAAPAAP